MTSIGSTFSAKSALTMPLSEPVNFTPREMEQLLAILQYAQEIGVAVSMEDCGKESTADHVSLRVSIDKVNWRSWPPLVFYKGSHPEYPCCVQVIDKKGASSTPGTHIHSDQRIVGQGFFATASLALIDELEDFANAEKFNAVRARGGDKKIRELVSPSLGNVAIVNFRKRTHKEP